MRRGSVDATGGSHQLGGPERAPYVQPGHGTAKLFYPTHHFYEQPVHDPHDATNHDAEFIEHGVWVDLYFPHSNNDLSRLLYNDDDRPHNPGARFGALQLSS